MNKIIKREVTKLKTKKCSYCEYFNTRETAPSGHCWNEKSKNYGKCFRTNTSVKCNKFKIDSLLKTYTIQRIRDVWDNLRKKKREDKEDKLFKKFLYAPDILILSKRELKLYEECMEEQVNV